MRRSTEFIALPRIVILSAACRSLANGKQVEGSLVSRRGHQCLEEFSARIEPPRASSGPAAAIAGRRSFDFTALPRAKQLFKPRGLDIGGDL